MMSAYPDLANPDTLWVAACDLLGGRNGRSKQDFRPGLRQLHQRGSAWKRSRTGMLDPTWVFDEEAV
jgi:hypothetical protein